ncbi:glycine zipper family protein [uncultured Ruegeria sp.]|uniref:glycine zipper family protein n=1 Tax=uncultured Ruegeria sp. TaxID=259304 RepID=UPI0026031CC7|nr:glycine zipper family protein [uncultured Ruegeria sp.]
MKLTNSCGILILGLTVAACSDSADTLIVDGQKKANFQSDLTACQQVSMQREKTNDGAITGAVIGGLVGAAEADSGDALAGLGIGAAVGGLIGTAEDSSEADGARKRIVFNCMRGRGHNVVG